MLDHALVDKQLQFWQDCKKALQVATQAQAIEATHLSRVTALTQQVAALNAELAERQAGLARFVEHQQVERTRLRQEADTERLALKSLTDAEQTRLLTLRSDVVKAQRQLDAMAAQRQALDRDLAECQRQLQGAMDRTAVLQG
jgi:chromosome segregation ATPase